MRNCVFLLALLTALMAAAKGFEKPESDEVRAAAAKVAKTGELKLESTYECISVAFGAGEELKNGVKLEYRAAGAKKWEAASPDPEFFRPGANYRGSILDLKEDTEYEVRVLAGGKEKATGKVRTWKTDVKVAKTVSVDVEGVKFPIRIDGKGKPDGWIRYVPKGGKEIENESWRTTLEVKGAEYVILEGFRIKGGPGKPTVRVGDAKGVRFRNCEIRGFGPAGRPKWGGTRGYCFENGIGCQMGAILLDENVSEVTIERCFIHSPRGRANSWRYSHPYGPAAVQVYRPESVVIRWCDFIGSDSHRFEDCVKSTKNGGLDTGLNRNSDVCGCFMFGANDDCIELDGGQQNVRCCRNRFEEALMGVSVQYDNTSPSYVYGNLFTGMGTEFGHKGAGIKTASVDAFCYGSVCYVLRNAFTGPYARDIALDMSVNGSTARMRVTDNVFMKGAGLKGETGTRFGIASGNRTVAKPVAKVGLLPERPVPWTLDAERIDVRVTKGKLAKGSATFTLTCGGKGYKQPFAVRTADLDAEWFDITPKKGTIASGKKTVFTVKFRPEALNARRRYAAAVVIRAADGFSRPLTLHAETDYVAPVVNPSPRDVVAYGKDLGDGRWGFDLPKEGTYYVFVRGFNPASSGDDFLPKENEMVIDVLGRTRESAYPMLNAWSTWAPVCPDTYNIYGYEMPAGHQEVKVVSKAPGMVIEGLALAREPMDMEGEKRNDEIK